MTRSPGRGGRERSDTPEQVAKRLQELLSSLTTSPQINLQELRAEVKRLGELLQGTRELSKLILKPLVSGTAARDRIRAYLKLFPGEVIEGIELQVVGGIQEFARRVRELRVQDGYNISTGYSREDLRPDQYVLESAEPESDAAEKWRTANRIRRQGGSARDRVLALLRAYIGRPVTGEQIAYVAKIREAPRRIRELRSELGWRVVTKQSGRLDLPPGVYVLETEEQLPPHDRGIPDDIYDSVLQRDGYKCRYCGWSVSQRHSAEKRQFLEVHHVEYHQEGGASNPENLVTLCNVHHDEVHRQGLRSSEFFNWLERK
jgi:hypothetical protein